MHKFIIALLTVAFVACNGNAQAPEQQQDLPFLNEAWASDKLWDDGLAEVAIYDAERVVYGKPRQFEYIYILVKEEFNKEFNVKTDDYNRADLFTVMKVNKFARIPTENYPYHYLTSLFYKREQPATLHKMTSSSQEWCGNTFKLFEHKKNGYEYTFHSYWYQQGTGKMKLDSQLWFEDGLSYTLRALDFRDGLTFEQPVVESQISNKANKPKVYKARFVVNDEEVSYLNTRENAWKVTVELEEGKLSVYWFKKEYPTVLLKKECWDRQKLQLKSVERTAYWEK